jgi:SAM domain (Sterile alpha motif)
MQRRRNTIVGDSADVIYSSDLHEPPQFGHGSSLNNEDRISTSQCSLELDAAHLNGMPHPPFYNPHDRDVNSSLSAAIDSSRTCCTSASCGEFNHDARTVYLSDASSTPDYVSLIVPPPPDFLSNSADFTESESSFGRGLAIITPPPPPGFDDDETRGCSSADVLHRPVFSWTIDDVASWLDSLRLSEHSDHFRECLIDGARLTKLGRSELIQLGVTQVGQRMNLERAIKRALMAKH